LSQLNENERNFIEDSLAGREGVELQETDEKLTILKKEKPKKSKRAKREKLPFLIGGFFILPFILTGIFMIALYRVESFVGGKSALEWLSHQKLDSEFAKTATAAGFDWMPQFLEVYSNRGLIIAITFTIPFLIAGALIAYDVIQRKDIEPDDFEEKSTDE
jgi:hypothetical protein